MTTNRLAPNRPLGKFSAAFGLGVELCLLASALAILLPAQDGQVRKFAVPRTWDDKVMNGVEVPLANPIGSPKQVSANYYYKIPVRPIYKQYPVYAPGREPTGYFEALKEKEPVVIWDGGSHLPPLKTETDWINAGKLVFSAALVSSEEQGLFVTADVRSQTWYRENGTPLTPDGVLPFLHYVIREKGKVELGSFSCAMCHTRIMPDGGLIAGAQGNFPFERALPTINSPKPRVTADLVFLFSRSMYAMPWLDPDPIDRQRGMSPDQFDSAIKAIPPGVVARHRSSAFTPVQVPDLIGLKDRRYFDRTGLQPHHSAVDLMRYSALNQGGDSLASFDGFIPADLPQFKQLPDPSDPMKVGGRYSDEQLYALALFIYSLKPPYNPNKFDLAAARGGRIFKTAGCAGCHAPPFYTNNKLTPVDGFKVPQDHFAKYDIAPVSVGTDTDLALKTRRGTGYYKVPSLRGVWYRNMFGHSGWCATLEDWLDPKRLHDDYLPTGFRPNGAKTFAVKGHAFGLTLSVTERAELIAFLKTL
jgi:hypothetical protein